MKVNSIYAWSWSNDLGSPRRGKHPDIPFGILEHWHPTLYGDYKRGFYKGLKYEVYDAKKYDQKLIYVSDKLSNWIKSKLIYVDNGIKKVMRADNYRCGKQS